MLPGSYYICHFVVLFDIGLLNHAVFEGDLIAAEAIPKRLGDTHLLAGLVYDIPHSLIVFEKKIYVPPSKKVDLGDQLFAFSYILYL